MRIIPSKKPLDEEPVGCTNCGGYGDFVFLTVSFGKYCLEIALCSICEHLHDWHHAICTHDKRKWFDCDKCNITPGKFGPTIDFTDMEEK